MRLQMEIASGALSHTRVVITSEVDDRPPRVEDVVGDVDLDLGPTPEAHGLRVRCTTSLHHTQPEARNRIDYTLHGGLHPWTGAIREDPPDPSVDIFFAEFVLVLPLP